MNDLDFAYKYPFSKEARDIIAAHGGAIEDGLLRAGKARLEEDLNEETVGYSAVSMDDIKRVHVLSYVYSRMLVSALPGGSYTDRYVLAESSRVGGALASESLPNITKLMTELGVAMSYAQGTFIMKFTDLLMLASRDARLRLSSQSLSRGLVYLDRDSAIRVLQDASAAQIRKKLPIPLDELPARVVEEAKTVRLPRLKTAVKVRESSYRWIERILSTPIADVRHRTVNLVLAPYLTNIRGMGEDEAASVIIEYIEKCKQVNPDTKVNAPYIKYQCKYAKSRGMKPLSLDRARELYRGVLDID